MQYEQYCAAELSQSIIVQCHKLSAAGPSINVAGASEKVHLYKEQNYHAIVPTGAGHT